MLPPFLSPPFRRWRGFRADLNRKSRSWLYLNLSMGWLYVNGANQQRRGKRAECSLRDGSFELLTPLSEQWIEVVRSCLLCYRMFTNLRTEYGNVEITGRDLREGATVAAFYLRQDLARAAGPQRNAHQRHPLRDEHLNPGGLRRHGAQPDTTTHGSGWPAFEHRPDERGNGPSVLRTVREQLVKLANLPPAQVAHKRGRQLRAGLMLGGRIGESGFSRPYEISYCGVKPTRVSAALGRCYPAARERFGLGGVGFGWILGRGLPG